MTTTALAPAPAPVRTIHADWWYRHADDTDQSIRQIPQMSSTHASTDELARVIREMRAGGYRLQRITLQSICPHCHADGRIVTRRFERQPPRYADCPTCSAAGLVGVILDWPLADTCEYREEK